MSEFNDSQVEHFDEEEEMDETVEDEGEGIG